MGTTKIDLKWKSKMAFDAKVNGHTIPLDADETVGGEDQGPRPKPLVLAALGGCTSMDVVSILKKMRIEFDDMNVSVSGELTDEHPKFYYKIHIHYTFKGKDLPIDKLERAVSLSQERYCGVTAMLDNAAEITYDIAIEE